MVPESVTDVLQEARAALLNPQLSDGDRAVVVTRLEGMLSMIALQKKGKK